MRTERVTVSLPSELRRALDDIAEERGASFSAVAAEALASWMRGYRVDAWLAEYRRRHGTFDESELRAVAAEMGVPYLPPRPRTGP